MPACENRERVWKMKAGFIIDYETIAARLANDGADEQAAFFRVFLKELRSVCATHHAAEMQLAFVNGLLTSDERGHLAMLSYEEPDA